MGKATVAIILSNYNHGRYLPESLGGRVQYLNAKGNRLASLPRSIGGDVSPAVAAVAAARLAASCSPFLASPPRVFPV